LASGEVLVGVGGTPPTRQGAQRAHHRRDEELERGYLVQADQPRSDGGASSYVVPQCHSLSETTPDRLRGMIRFRNDTAFPDTIVPY